MCELGGEGREGRREAIGEGVEVLQQMDCLCVFS